MTTQSTTPQTIVVADLPADWSRILDFEQFDSSLGTLLDVRITVIGDVTGVASVENLSPLAGSAGISLPATISIADDASGILSTVTVDPTATINLGAYDGTIDYAGASGTVVAGISAVSTSASVLTLAGAAADAFIGIGTIALTANAKASSNETGNANLVSYIQANAGARVVLQYDYADGPAGGSSSDHGSGMTLSNPSLPPFGMDIPNAITTTATYAIADALSGWSDLLPVQRFNPMLGTLEGVNITLTGNIVATMGLENTSGKAATVSVTEGATITLGLPGAAALSVQPTLAASARLGPSDGISDFAGTSGTILSGLTNLFPTNAGEGITDPGVLAAFTGAGSIDIPIFSVGTSVTNGGPSLFSLLSQWAGATVTVSYLYAPATDVACFVTGTLIETPSGPVPVEALPVGGSVLTRDGRCAPIAWIGHRTIDCSRHERPEAVWPVRVAAHAFGVGAPARDLFLSPDHAIAIDGVLIPICHLIDGETIVSVRRNAVTYWHVELDRHDVLLAEGLAVESFLDTGNRGAFANGGGAVQMHPDFAAWRWEAAGCAPLVVTGPEVEAVRARLATRRRVVMVAA